MKLSLRISEILLLLKDGNIINASSARNSVIENLIDEGILYRKGRIKKTILLVNKDALDVYLKNQLGVSNLERYIELLKKEDVKRSELVAIGEDSKIRAVRSFKGFLINSYDVIKASLNGKTFIIEPTDGVFNFIYDFESFILDETVTIIGIENPENFRRIGEQRYLFNDANVIFVCRYPQNQSKDLIKWLSSISNKYVHFGDFDIAGIGIYLNEYKKYLKDRASFFIPDNIDDYIKNFGSRERFDNQKVNFNIEKSEENALIDLMHSINRIRKGLDQEFFIKS